MVIIGIDPGIATTGYSVVKETNKNRKLKNKNILKCLEYGVIETEPSLSSEKRLRKLHLEISGLIKKHKPRILAVESVYFFKNQKTAIPVSEAKGVILLAAAQKKIPVMQFTPLQVKMTVCNYGRGTKSHVQKMVKKILGLKTLPSPDDASDALALAICSFDYLKR